MINQISALDQSVLLAFNRVAGFFGFGVNRFLAEYLIYLIPIILIGLWFYEKKGQKAGLQALFSVVLAWPFISLIINNLVKRVRPNNLTGVKELLFHRPDFSFPSDHAAAFFAVAAAFYLSGYKRISYILLILAIINSFFRIAMVIHWPTDILAGVIIGFVSAYAIKKLDKPLNRVYNLIIKLAKIIRLS